MDNKTTLLTPKQQETLNYIKDYISKNRTSPLISELCRGLKLKSMRSVTQRLESLESKGLIKRDRFKHRGISILENINPFSPDGTIRIPVIASAGCDAMEIFAQEHHDEYISIDKNLINGHKDITAIKAVGNSMLDAGIHNGDYVIVEVTNNVSNGDRVVAVIGDMAVIKKLHITSTSHILEPESKGNGYSPIIMGDNSKIFGKVLSVISMSEPSDDYQLVFEPGEK
jgi:repressor LexA